MYKNMARETSREYNTKMAEQKEILIIEDDKFLSSLLKARFTKETFGVRQAFDGEEALAMLKEKHPDLIVLDLIMPKVSGFEVLEAISIDPNLQGIPVFIVSNLAQDTDVQRARQFGAKEYFVKVRISIDELVGKVREYLGGIVSPGATPPVVG